MPVVSLTLDESNRTILSPVYYKIVQDIVDVIKIPNSTVVVMHRDTEQTLTDNKPNVSSIEESNIPSTVSKRRIVTSITEEYNEDALTTTAVHQLSTYPIFKDDEVDVYIYPIYVKMDINIDFSFVTPSKTEANRIRDDIRIRLSQTRNITIHDIDYTILIPKEVEDFIVDVYELKNRLVPQPLDFYFKEHTTNRIHPITDMSNKENVRLGIYEKQTRIIGTFDFSSMPEKIESDMENNNYKLNFTYKLTIDVPKAICFRYPTMICNRPMPAKYLSFIEDHKRKSLEENKRIHNYTSLALSDMSIFEAHRQLENRIDIKLPINIPAFDDFNERIGYKGYCILVSYLTDVNEEDKRTLFNLNDTSPYEIQEPLISYIKEIEYDYITKPYTSIFYLGLHQQGKFFNADFLKIDSSLNIVSRREIPLFKPTRVTFSFLSDLSLLSNEAWKRYSSNTEILLFIIREYLYIRKQFKTELKNSNDERFFLDKTITFIIEYINSNKLQTVKDIIEILEEDYRYYEAFVYLLKSEYRNLLGYLVREDLIKVNSTNGNTPMIQQRNTNKGIMKTVMSTSVIAMKV